MGGMDTLKFHVTNSCYLYLSTYVKLDKLKINQRLDAKIETYS